MEDKGLEFRATKDLDIVLEITATRGEFGRKFWEFIELGAYQIRQNSEGKSQYFRFQNPGNSEFDFPVMLELFSSRLDLSGIDAGSTLVPVPMGEDASSLSAILLDDDYYQLIQLGKTLINGLPVVSAPYLIPLKAKAWLDLTARKDNGGQVDSKSIKKHLRDVFRLVSVITPDYPAELPNSVKADMKAFVEMAGSQAKCTPVSPGITNDLNVLDLLVRFYSI
jgi:hypothetical protein